MDVFEDQRQKEQTAGFIGLLIAGLFLWRTLSAYAMQWQGLFRMPSGLWFVITTTTCLALLIWSVGHLIGDYRHNQLYSRLIGILSSLAVGSILVFVGYIFAQ
ncbi:hypothetical protein ACFFQF_32210 [Haladaptatus pallidirubidus]|uniref:Uncharacterized protein n=1 Tax=Haladaptatus pallidirubidus TaxID=1008152 RepID=A0AAV3UMK4_9EURY|nr:hypothetical protein [Haladaptatus pallidirubidus]